MKNCRDNREDAGSGIQCWVALGELKAAVAKLAVLDREIAAQAGFFALSVAGSRWTLCVQWSLQSSPRQHVRMTPEETVNEPALGWLREETYIASAEVEAEPSRHSSTASGGFLQHGQQILKFCHRAEMTLATRVTWLWYSVMVRPWTV